MTAISAGGATQAAASRSDLRVTFGRTMRSEWTKFYSLRSTYWTFLAAVVILVGFGALITYGITSSDEAQAAGQLGVSDLPFDLVSISFQGIQLAQLAIGVLGVLMVTGEYSTGMIRATFAAVPRRVPIVIAKAMVMGLSTLAVMIPAALACFFIGQAILDTLGFGGDITDPGVIRAVIGAGLYLVVIGVIGGALGWMLRSAAGAIATLVGLITILPILVEVIQIDWIQSLGPYLPSSAGQAIFWVDTGTLEMFAPGSLSPWTGFALFCGYAVAALVLASVLVLRRDA